jgi:chromosome segregation ATPase
MDNQFRNAAFGGFNRQDVMDYLERTAREHSQELAQLQARVDEVQGERDALAARVEQAEAAGQELARERDAARQETQQERGSCVSAQERVRALESRLAQAEAENERLRSRVAQLTPDAEAYAALKERTVGMELEAHRRAQSVEARARIMAGDLQRQMEQWMAKVEKQYAGLKTEVEASVERANQQILAASGSLSSINTLLEEQQSALKSVVDSYADSVRGKKAE